MFLILQIRVVAFDSCNPVQKVAAFVRVTVVRNENRPVFAQAEYTVNIEDTQPLGVSVATITAEDKDVVSPGLGINLPLMMQLAVICHKNWQLYVTRKNMYLGDV